MGRSKDVDEEFETEVDEDDMEEEIDGDADRGPGRSFAGVIGFAAGLALGAVLGAGIALLTTPVRGDVMRRRLKHRIRDVSDDAVDRVEQLKDEAGRSVSRTRRRLQRVRRNR